MFSGMRSLERLPLFWSGDGEDKCVLDLCHALLGDRVRVGLGLVRLVLGLGLVDPFP
jgi:hypothetical protein